MTEKLMNERPAPGAERPSVERLVMMPERLTAENGAKGLLSGEFKVEINVVCPECEGFGLLHYPPDEEEVCFECKGSGSVKEIYPIDWTTIKEIYAMAVKRLAT